MSQLVCTVFGLWHLVVGNGNVRDGMRARHAVLRWLVLMLEDRSGSDGGVAVFARL